MSKGRDKRRRAKAKAELRKPTKAEIKKIAEQVMEWGKQ